MLVKLDAKVFLSSLKIVGEACAGRTPHEVMRHVRLTAQTNAVQLQATDGEIGIVRTITDGVTVSGQGDCLLDPKQLGTILGLVEGDVTIDAEPGRNGKITVQAGNGNYSLPWLDPADMPDALFGTADHFAHEAPAAELADRIRLTAFAAASADGRFAMRGVLLNTSPDGYNVVATDGKRLAVSNPITSTASALIPPRCALLLRRVCEESAQPVQFGATTSNFTARVGDTHITSRLLEGKFPEYTRVIPPGELSVATLNAGAFLADVRLAASMTDEDSKRVDLQFSSDGQTLTLQAQSPTHGSALVSHTLIAYEGSPVKISLDPAYLLDMLREVEADTTLTLRLNGGDKSAVFETGDYLYLVVPMV